MQHDFRIGPAAWQRISCKRRPSSSKRSEAAGI